MKTILYIVLAVVLLGAAFFTFNQFIYTQKQGSNDSRTQTVMLEGVVTAVDLDAIALDGPARITFETAVGEEHTIAVPSMGLPLCAAREEIDSVHSVSVGDRVAVRGNLDENEMIVPCSDATHYFHIGGTYTDIEHGFQFEYQKGEGGYVLQRDIPNMSHDATFVTGLQLISFRELTELENATVPREGPPTMQVRVYRNADNLWPAVWADRHSRESNVELQIGEQEEAAVGGANAVRYITDGLYATDTYVAAHGAYVYILTGSYIDQDSDIYRDFQTLIETFTFVPANTKEGE